MNTATALKPAWTTADLVGDITDNWIDEVDPQAELGEVVSAYFKADIDGELTLRGISVEGSGYVLYHDRLKAEAFLSIETIWRIEEVAMEGRTTASSYAVSDAADTHGASWRFL